MPASLLENLPEKSNARRGGKPNQKKGILYSIIWW